MTKGASKSGVNIALGRNKAVMEQTPERDVLNSC